MKPTNGLRQLALVSFLFALLLSIAGSVFGQARLAWSISDTSQQATNNNSPIVVDTAINIVGSVENRWPSYGDTTMKWDAEGNQLWSVPTIGGHFALDSSENVYVSGYDYVADSRALTKLNPEGTNLWSVSTTVAADQIALDNAGNAYIHGYDHVARQYAITKFNPQGTNLWSVVGLGVGWGSHAALDSADNLYLACYDYVAGGVRLK